MGNMFISCYSLQTIPQLDTSQVTDMNSMFSSCYSLQTIPELNTSNVINMGNMFRYCYALQAIPELNTSKVTNMNSMFEDCPSLQAIPELNTSKVTIMSNMFYNCHSLQKIPQLDINLVTDMNSMFRNCYILIITNILNIKTNLTIGSGTSYGHLLTLDSLIGLCKECINTGFPQTLTVGSANLNKIQNSGKFYKFVDPSVTEVAVGEKGEIEECDSTVTGSFTISDYMAMKNWTLA